MASEDIQPLLDSQPPALPANVARVTADGRPTTHLLDWETFQTNWFKQNIIATDQRIDTVKAAAEGVEAAVAVETAARISADSALSSQITSVSAIANQATANGQIYFAAMAGPGGSAAAYGIFLTAGDAYTGMQLVAKSGGGGAIVFDADYFALNDSGSMKNVFRYSGGKLRFGVPVVIETDLIEENAITTVEAETANSVMQVYDTGGNWQTIIEVEAQGGTGYSAIVHADFEYRVTPGWTGIFEGEFRIVRNNGDELYGPAGLFNPTQYVPVSINRLVSSFTGTRTYRVQVKLELTHFSGDTPSAQFRRRGIMIDLRKR